MFEDHVDRIARALHSSYSTEEVCSQLAVDVSIDVFVVFGARGSAPRRREMNMNIDQPGQQGLARRFDRLSVQRLRFGSRSGEDVGDLTVFDEDGAAFDHSAIA